MVVIHGKIAITTGLAGFYSRGSILIWTKTPGCFFVISPAKEHFSDLLEPRLFFSFLDTVSKVGPFGSEDIPTEDSQKTPNPNWQIKHLPLLRLVSGLIIGLIHLKRRFWYFSIQVLLFLSRRWRKLPGRGRCPVSLKGSKGSPVNDMLQTALSSRAFDCCWFCGKKQCYQIPHSKGFGFSSSNLFVDLSWFCESIRKCLSIRMYQVPAKKLPTSLP